VCVRVYPTSILVYTNILVVNIWRVPPAWPGPLLNSDILLLKRGYFLYFSRWMLLYVASPPQPLSQVRYLLYLVPFGVCTNSSCMSHLFAVCSTSPATLSSQMF
jgi:hypothetical protein